jgi:hypothetical protein
MIEKIISCSCRSPEHTLTYNLNTEDREVYTSVFLHQYRPFYQRVWIAIKYIFGYNSRYGHWDCFSADREKILELKEFFDLAVEKTGGIRE